MDETRRVNLNEKVRTILEIEISDRTFRISRVVTGVRQLYAGILTDAGTYMQRVGELQGKLDELGDAKDSEEFIRIERQLEVLTEEVNEFAERKQAELMRCVELLMSKNGYEYDRDWWTENTDETDIKAFIVECLNKDVPSGSKKKTGGGESLTGSGSALSSDATGRT